MQDWLIRYSVAYEDQSSYQISRSATQLMVKSLRLSAAPLFRSRSWLRGGCRVPLFRIAFWRTRGDRVALAPWQTNLSPILPESVSVVDTKGKSLGRTPWLCHGILDFYFKDDGRLDFFRNWGPNDYAIWEPEPTCWKNQFTGILLKSVEQSHTRTKNHPKLALEGTKAHNIS